MSVRADAGELPTVPRGASAPRRTRLPTEAVVGAASLVSGWALVHLLRASATQPSSVPVLVGCGATAVVVAAAGRRWPASVLVLLGVPVALLAATWVVLPGATRGGLPTPTTVRALHRALAAVRTSLAAGVAPLPARPGTVWLAAAVGGTAAVAARALAAYPGRPARVGAPLPLVALGPTVLLVAASDLLRPDATAGALAAAAAAVAVAALALGPHGTSRAPGRASPRPPAHVAALAGLAVLAAAGTAVAAAPTPSSPQARSTVATLLLEDRVTTARQANPGLVVFTARAPVATYWQVATLRRFRAGRWLPGATVRAAAADRSLPDDGPALPGPGGLPRRFRVTLRAYGGTLLPAPPGTVSVAPAAPAASASAAPSEPTAPSGPVPETVLPDAGVVAWRGPGPVPAGLRYTATAPAALPVAGDPAVVPAGAASPADLALPSLPPAVVALAHEAVAGAGSPLARTRALLAFFATGGFRYTTVPPRAPAGSDPLVWFLTTTRRGSCQQFAGAFAVLARLDGLPTRVAVGFTAGSVEPGGATVVRGRDAHAWPEVYLGPALGWQSVEPTPPAGDGPSVPVGVLRSSGTPEPPGLGGSGTGPTTGPTPTTTPPATGPAPTTTPPTAPTAPKAPAPTRGPAGARRGGGGLVLPLAAAVSGLAVLASALALLVRRTSERRRARRLRRRGWDGPEARVLAAWAELERRLARSGRPRPPHRTASAHARVVGAGLPVDAAVDLSLVARDADAVVFSPLPVTAATAARAVDAGRRLQRSLAGDRRRGGRRTPG